MGKIIDLTGKKFGRLTVIEQATSNNKNRTMWRCVCECGNETIVYSYHLRNGSSTSCGCFRREVASNRTTHGKTNSRIYHIWAMMKERCFCPTLEAYENYGGRGITVCDEWKNDFQAFYDWAIANGYKDDLTIDRINVDGNYEPSNCRWSTMEEQANNKRNNHYLTARGETKTVAQWSKTLGLKIQVIRSRIHYGWTDEDVLYRPVQIHKKRKQR